MNSFHLYMYMYMGDCLTSRPKGHLRPRELWFSIYSCTGTTTQPVRETRESKAATCTCDIHTDQPLLNHMAHALQSKTH